MKLRLICLSASRVKAGGRLCVGVLAVLSLPLACQSDDIVCPLTSDPAIIVEVRDGSTGAAAAVGATGEIRSGSFVSLLVRPAAAEQLQLYSSGPAATYDIVVRKEGYRDWTRSGVYVRGGNCGLERTVVLRANLERLAL